MKKFMALLMVTLMMGFLAGACKGKKEESLNPGDPVFAQWIEGEGETWEEARVVKVEGDKVTIAWKDTFAKGGETEVTKDRSKVVKIKKLKKDEVKEGMKVMVQPPGYSSWVYFMGKVTGINGDRYRVKFKAGSTENEVEVGIDALWAGE